MTRLLLALLAAVWLCGATAGAAESAPPAAEQAGELFAHANAAYARAIDTLATRPTAARRDLAEAARLYERLLETAPAGDTGVAALQYNLGNARLLAGENAPAVLAYKRSLLHRPGDDRVLGNLAIARDRVAAKRAASTSAAPAPPPPAPTEAPPGAPERRLADTVRPLLDALPLAPVFYTFVAASGAAWLLALWRVAARRRTPVRPPALAVAAVFLIAALSLGLLVRHHLAWSRNADAILMTETLARTGPDDLTHEPAIAAPLPAGSEVAVLEERTGTGLPAWARVRIDTPRDAAGREAWLPAASLTRVRPR